MRTRDIIIILLIVITLVLLFRQKTYKGSSTIGSITSQPQAEHAWWLHWVGLGSARSGEQKFGGG